MSLALQQATLDVVSGRSPADAAAAYARSLASIVGGADKVPTFVALLGAQKSLNIATLIDLQSKDAQTVEKRS